MKHDLVIFDLDGTLLDTSPGIFGSVRYAEQVLKLKPIGENELREFVGPPPREMYRKKYNLSDEDALKATSAHRKYGLEKAIYEAEKYDGMQDVLEELKNRNLKTAVATLKKQKIAETVLGNYSLDKYFDVIIGMDDEETFTKKMTITKAMEAVGASRAVMVGDSEYDYQGALDAGVDFVGVLYGFGFRKDESYPFRTVNSPTELLEILDLNIFKL